LGFGRAFRSGNGSVGAGGEVCANPEVSRVFRKETRRHFGGRFPYAVIYVDEADYVLVLAFAHFKRRPGYWVERLLRQSS
jgi:hypothetical protein